MARDATELLNDILRSVDDILEYVAGLDRDAFLGLPDADGKTYRAIKNAISEMGEAIKGLPKEITDRHPSVDWRGLAALRDVIAHQYHRVDMEMLWPVVHEELPAFAQELENEVRRQASKPT